MKCNEITALVTFEYNHSPFDLNKIIELTEKINEILIEVDPSLEGKLNVSKRRGICPLEMPIVSNRGR